MPPRDLSVRAMEPSPWSCKCRLSRPWSEGLVFLDNSIQGAPEPSEEDAEFHDNETYKACE